MNKMIQYTYYSQMQLFLPSVHTYWLHDV